MATEVITIPATASQRADMNWDLLREEGIAILQQLAGQIWTDYNSHDPGVTLLEALCYAITDLGYRTEFEMEDLLTADPSVVVDPDDPDTASDLRNFITMAQVAIMCPLTPIDYRKFLIDCDGVRNGWLQKAEDQEQDIGIDKAGTQLVLSPDPAFAGSPRLELNGLYEVLLEFEEDPRFGDLNSNALSMTVDLPISLINYKVLMEFQMPCWEEVPADFDQIDFNDAALAVNRVGFGNIDNDFFSHAMSFTIADSSRSVDLPVQIRVLEGQEGIPKTSAYTTGIQAWLDDQNNTQPIFVELQNKRAHTLELINEIKVKLCDYRNLCEDFFEVRPMDIQEIGLCLEVEVDPETDCDRVLAEVNYQMQRFLSPTVRFYNLPEMFEKGYTSDEIFNGPLLENGFIDEAELRLYRRRTKIYTSDLVQLFMDIEGVNAINKLTLSNYVKGNVIGQDAIDCLILTAPSKFLPRLSMRHSEITFDKGDNVPTSADANRAGLFLNELKALDSLRRGAGDEMDLAVPTGTYLPLAEYASIQEELPMIYGVGSEGLDPDADDLRKSKALQLKGYLVFFEQILANYLSQLANLRRIFALKGSTSTYFSQVPNNIPGINTVLSDAVGYPTTLQDLIEDTALFEDRRNRFLDHLIARFNESFSDYALWCYSRKGAQAPAVLIKDKEAFLSDYPAASVERAKAYNYKDETDAGAIWGSDNVSGLKKRVSLLLGFGSYNRDQIARGQASFQVFQDSSSMYKFWLKQNGMFVLIESTTTYGTRGEAEIVVCETIEASANPDNLQVVPDGGNFKFEVLGKDGTAIAGFSGFATENIAQLALESYINYLNTLIGAETFHVLENILLRPKLSTSQTLPIFLDPNCADQMVIDIWGDSFVEGSDPARYNMTNYMHYQMGESVEPVEGCPDCECLEVVDPYSFRIKVIAPTWTDRFRDPAFRKLFRKTVREATPAHIFVEFLFIDFKEMVGFENCYADWLFFLGTGGHLPDTNEQAPNCMASQFETLCSRYEAYYQLVENKKISGYEKGEVLAFIADQDGKIVHASEVTEPSGLPAGVVLNELTGELVVADPSLLVANTSFSIQVVVWNSSGEKHCLEFNHTFSDCVDTHIAVTDGKFTSAYTAGDPLITITHPSESFTVLPDLSQPGALPPGFGFVSPNLIVVADPNLIRKGNHLIEFTTQTASGCVTEHRVKIKFPGDQKAFTTPLVNCGDNEDTIEVDTALFTVRDYDGGIAQTGAAPNFLPDVQWTNGTWTSSGIDLKFGSEVEGDSAVVYVSDPDLFRNTLKASATVGSDNCYRLTMNLTVRDANGGVTILTHVVEVLKDTEARIDQDVIQNYHSYKESKAIAYISDDVNGGIDTWTPVTDVSKVGLKLVKQTSSVSGRQVLAVILNDRDLFWKMVPTDFGTDPNTGNLTYSIFVDTVDFTGGKSSGPHVLKVLPNRTVDPTPGSSVDVNLVTPGKVLTELVVSGGGSMTALAPIVESDTYDRGLGVQLQPDSTDPAIQIGVIVVEDVTRFHRSLYQGLWTYDPALGKFTSDLEFRVENSEEGVEAKMVTVETSSNLSEPVLPYNDMRINEYFQGAQLLVTTEPASAITGSLPSGTTTNVNATTGLTEIIVDGLSSLEESTKTVTINGVDFDLNIQRPMYTFRKEITGDPHIGSFVGDEMLSGLSFDGPQEEIFPDYGRTFTLTLDGATYPMVGHAFTNAFLNSQTTLSADFDGTINGTDPVLIRVEFTPVPRPYSALVNAILAEEEAVYMEDSALEQLLQDTASSLGTLDADIFPNGVPNFGEDFQLKDAYRDGDRDVDVALLLQPLLDQCYTALFQLRSSIAEKSGSERNADQDKYRVNARLLKALAFAAFDFCTTIRSGELAEGSDLDRMISELSSNISDLSR